MERRNVRFIAVKSVNMIKSDEEAEYYGFLSRLGRRSKPSFQLQIIGEVIRAVSRRGLLRSSLDCWLSTSIS